ncbi:uncharacterized protein METZ01_LOCUS287015, partial [marine metagenome]
MIDKHLWAGCSLPEQPRFESLLGELQ